MLCAWTLPAANQERTLSPASRAQIAADAPGAASRRARAFAASNGTSDGGSAAAALALARAQHAALLQARNTALRPEGKTLRPQDTSLTTPWTPVGPAQVQSQSYGLVTGRVTSIALDPNDASNNTVYVGTSGGGVWKSTNAAGTASQVSFTPLTDTLPVFSPNSGTSAIPSLSIGALTVQPGGTGVVLAGTGDPNDAADSYYGEGILRSADNGQTWSQVTNAHGYLFLGEGIAGFAWSTTSPNVVVAAVAQAAEANTVGASLNAGGVRGLYVSTDAGRTWTVASIQDGSTVVQSQYTDFTYFRGNSATSVVWNPVRSRFYAAVRSHGYYESSDGMTWTRLASQPGTGLTLAACPSRPNTYGLASCPIFRGALAAQPVSGDLFALTVSSTNASGGLWQSTCNASGSSCASSTVAWDTKIASTTMEDNGSIPQGDYNLLLSAVPAATSLSTHDTLLFAGAADLYRCGLAGGCTLRNTTNATTGCAAPAGVAPAQHALAWGLNASNTATPAIFLGNDGGLWRSLDGIRQQSGVCSADDATHFDNLNGALGSLAEVAGMSSDPTNGNIVLAALGANGSAVSTTPSQASASSPWTQLSAAESGVAAIDQGNGSNWMVQSGAGVSLQTCTSGSNCTASDFAGAAAIGTAQAGGDVSLTDPPALLDPQWNANVIVGTCRVWRGPASGGSAWSSSNAISPLLAGPAGSVCQSGNPTIRSLAAGGPLDITNGAQNSGSRVLYAGLSGTNDGGGVYGGHIYVNRLANSASSSTPWTDITTSTVTNDTARFNAGAFAVSSIAVDRTDTTGFTVYATIQGFGYPHVYRSTDGGSTWTNISANLPNAPANSVAVDPNNARVVYVAMDTGVYVTQDVTACVSAATGATGSCWSVFGSGLPNAPVTSLTVSQGFAVPGSTASGVLRAGTFGRGIWQAPLLSAGQTLLPAIAFSPASLSFASQNVGTTGNSTSVTLLNTGNAALQISSVSASTGFVETDNCTGSSIVPNGTCTLQVRSAPVNAGTYSGSVQVVGNVSGGYAALPLSGNGAGVPNVTLPTAAVQFPDTTVNSTSAAQTVIVTNSGTADATLTGFNVSPDFAISSNTCGVTLPRSASCTVGITFTPSSAGNRSGTLSVTDTAGTRSETLTGKGVGITRIDYSATAFDFGTAVLNDNGGLRVLTITNSGTTQTSLSTPALSATDYRIYKPGCTDTLSPGQSCDLPVFFSPLSVGPRPGRLTIVDATGTHTVTLTGSGVSAAAVSITQQLTFTTVEVNSVSAAQTITMTNSGSAGVYLGVTQVVGDFGVTTNTCVNYLGGGNSCQMTVIFGPTADGARVGYISVVDGSGITHTTLLSGTAHGTPSVAVSPVSIAFGTVGVGSTSTGQTVSVSNSGTAAIALSSPAVSGDFTIASSTCGASLGAGATCALSLTFTPTAEGSRTGSLTVTDALATHSVSLSGTGQGHAVIAVSPATLDFSTVALNSSSAAQTVTLANSGNAAIGLMPASVSGDFAISANTCGSSLAAGTSCTVSVIFSPTAAGSRSGTLGLADTAAQHPVALTGIGQGTALVIFSASTLTFGNTAVGAAAVSQTVTLANTGTAAVTLAQPSITGDFIIGNNTCGATLAVNSTCSMSIAFLPSAPGVRSGVLSITDQFNLHTVTLRGSGIAGTLSPSSAALSFYDTTVNTTTVAQTLTLTNTGTGTLTVASMTTSDDFAATGNCVTLTAGSKCTLQVTFSPKTSGTHVGALTVVSDTGGHAGTSTVVALSGNGKYPFNVALTPASVDFGTQSVNTTSAVRNITVSNTGTKSGALGAISIAGDFAIGANTCGSSLAPQVGCTVSVTFTPTGSGTRNGTLTVTGDAGTLTASLTGAGASPATDALSPTSLTFTSQVVGTVSTSQSITLTNSGDAALTLVSAQVLTGDFTAINGCGPTLPAHASCSIAVSFAPKSVGDQTGVLQISDVLKLQTVALKGTAIAGPGISLSPAAIAFPATGVGTVSAGQPVTFTNNGGVPLQLSSFAVSGDFGIVSGSNTCSTSAAMPVGGSCSMSIAFLPSASGARAGSIVINSNAAVKTSQLSGAGIDFTFAVSGSDTASISSGASAAYPLLLRPAITTNDPVTYTCSGAPAYTKCTVTSQYSDLSAVSTVTVTLLTGTTAKSVRLILLLPLLPGLLLLACGHARHNAGRLLALFILLSAGALQGCGSGKASAGSGSGTTTSGGTSSSPTPSGTYTITATATAAGVTHNVPLTLIVK